MKPAVLNSFLSLILVVCSLIITFKVYAQNSVKMKGSIIETACAIELDSQDQTIDMGSVPISHIIRDGQGPSRYFAIRLVSCALENPNYTPKGQYFQITFDGPHSQGLFHIQGQAEGVGVQIKRHDNGEVIIPGKSMIEKILNPGSQDLTYQLLLISNRNPLISGGYTSQIRFKLDYN